MGRYGNQEAESSPIPLLEIWVTPLSCVVAAGISYPSDFLWQPLGPLSLGNTCSVLPWNRPGMDPRELVAFLLKRMVHQGVLN